MGSFRSLVRGLGRGAAEGGGAGQSFGAALAGDVHGEIDGGRTVTDTGFQTILGPTSLYSGAYTDMWYAPADTSNNYWQSQADAYNNACGAHGYVVYWPSDNSEYPCA